MKIGVQSARHHYYYWHTIFLVQYFFILSTIYTVPQVTASLYYSNIIFSLMISYFIFQQGATVYTLLGVLLIVGAGLGVIYLQRKKNLALAQINRAE
ncbi:MAG: LPXTG cell wall anchor domain-containing protein [Gammaproteobacteria bacterium]|nr:LPXTG cell wall anchor domain-containing protein [Gammaproteobacteria bacterium]